MPKILGTCSRCGSRVPQAISLEAGKKACFQAHECVSPCPHCGGKIEIKDGTYTALPHKFMFSPIIDPIERPVVNGPPYGEFLSRLTREFEAELDKIEATHNFEFGPEFEIAICKILRRVLPSHFGVCRGFVVDQYGNEEGNDVIIFDKLRYPRLRPTDEFDVETTQRIPIEAVYAYIEAKHTIALIGTGGQSFAKALDQVANVKALCATREPVPLNTISRSVRIEGVAIQAHGQPKIKNPVFTAILSRFVRLREQTDHIPPSKVYDQYEANAFEIPSPFLHGPDLVMLGTQVLMYPVIQKGGNVLEYVSPFLVEDARLVVASSESSLALSLCSILYALDDIELGRLNWPSIIGRTIGERPSIL